MNTMSAYILAGGKSTRMATDKGLLPLNEKTIVSHIYDALHPIAKDKITIISSNSDYDFLGCERIEDIIPNKGPVGGIYTALNHCDTKYTIIVSVDVPFISTELIEWIIAKHTTSIEMTQVQTNNKPSPLIAVYNKSLQPIFKENTENNLLKLRNVIDTVPHQTLEVPEKWAFQLQNINTEEEYQKIIV